MFGRLFFYFLFKAEPFILARTVRVYDATFYLPNTFFSVFVTRVYSELLLMSPAVIYFYYMASKIIRYSVMFRVLQYQNRISSLCIRSCQFTHAQESSQHITPYL